MSRIPMQHRGKRPRFFAAEGMDELVSMVLELTAEVWVVKKRLYLLERVAAGQGVSLTPGIEDYELNATEIQELDELRSRLIATVLRSTEGQYSPTQRIKEGSEAAGQNAEAA